MAKSKLNLENSNLVWNPQRRYKVNEIVTYFGKAYQNLTGKNSEPGVSSDWFVPEYSIFVPYTGATSNVDLGEFQLKANGGEFDGNVIVPNAINADEAVNLGQLDAVFQNAIPYTGTTQPITGDFEFESGKKNYTTTESLISAIGFKSGSLPYPYIQFNNPDIFNNEVILTSEGLKIFADSGVSRGIISEIDFSTGITDLDYTQKIYVDTGLSTKLDASAYNDRFKGKFTSLVNLETALPTANAGDYAQVDAGSGDPVQNYNYDVEDGWILGGDGSGATDTDALVEGSTNLYFTTARVLSTLLSGISFATGGSIVSTDSILTAFGKLQKQISDAISQLFWTVTGDNIRNNNVGNIELKMNTGKKVSFLNNSNTEVANIDIQGNFGGNFGYFDTVEFPTSGKGIRIGGNGSNYFRGFIGSRWESDILIKYASDLSASYDARSLVDKGFIDTRLNNQVPYTGATSNVDLGEYQIKAGQLELDQTPTGTFGVAKMQWNDTDGTVDIGLKGGNVTLQVGQEQVLRVVNKTGINLLQSEYKVVYISGAQGNRLKVDLALSNNTVNSNKTIGLITENINNNLEGFVTTSGLVRDINTTGSLQSETWVDGDVLYVSPTVSGGLTNVLPASPNHKVLAGYVVRAHATQGSIFVKVDTGLSVEELHNVNIVSTTANKVLGSTTEGVWENKTVDSILGYTPLNKSNNLSDLTNTKTARVNIGLDKRTTFGNANYSALITDREIVTSATLTAPRTVTLIAGVNAGAEIIVADEFQTVTSVNTLTITVPTGKTLNGVLNGTEVIKATGGWRRFICDGNDNYIFDAGVARLSGSNFTGAITATNLSGTNTGDQDLSGKLDVTGYLTITSSATPVTLTSSSPRFIIVTGSVAQTIILPVTSTLTLGHEFRVINNSTNSVTVTSSGGNTVGTTIANVGAQTFYCVLTSGTTAASWQNLFIGGSGRTGNGSLVYNNNPSFVTPSYSVSATVTAGTNTQGQGALSSDVNLITTTATNPSGVTLPSAATASRHITVINRGTNPINVYPASGSQIDALGTNVSYQIPVNGVMVFNSSSSTQWYTEFDGFVLKGINNSTTTILNSATLNSTYPGATTGFRVYCSSIIAGAMTYEKTPTGWLGFACVTP